MLKTKIVNNFMLISFDFNVNILIDIYIITLYNNVDFSLEVEL